MHHVLRLLSVTTDAKVRPYRDFPGTVDRREGAAKASASRSSCSCACGEVQQELAYQLVLGIMQLPAVLGRASSGNSPALLVALAALSGLYLLLWPSHHHRITEIQFDALKAPLSALVSSGDGEQVRWDDWTRIKRHTRPYQDGMVAPLRLRHLEQYHAPEPWREVGYRSLWNRTQSRGADFLVCRSSFSKRTSIRDLS